MVVKIYRGFRNKNNRGWIWRGGAQPEQDKF
jgi:hypothetical protein